MRARIRILTQTLGSESLFETDGEGEPLSDGAAVTYRIEGDRASLEFFRDRIRMRRIGETGLFANFLHSETSKLRMKCRGAETEIPVYTRICRCEFSTDSVSAQLVYDLALSSPQRFSLAISIDFSEAL